ncbi:hypothetical protein PLESTB_000738600 [Pleodorina starrii]|uniref:protein-L-isoaspartate(D-aspartate) O-methyltransferase n=1 Tax=Pleodorina starrii TaxID=330485 RepID=A0A9W6BJI6_9CHLO|nr:hypothetical protein PLESTM_000185800 [Pleodorina starrii]GLC53381.1 hypothetical protein PLESTB_000738600 [Pleodorina starrii]GLC67149.1 hypothetical protein PLESTF_000522500 [Pleodorina starrii]
MANNPDERRAELLVNLPDDSDEDEDGGPAPAPGQPRRDRLERIALFDFLRLVAGGREPQPGYRTVADLVAHLKANETLTSDAVSRAMLACPRDLFVPPAHRGEALADRPIRVEVAGFNISAPHVQAVSLQALALEPGERVLDVGCGCGIVTAYAAYLAGSSGEVVGIDIRDAAISMTTANLQRLRAQKEDFCEVAAPVRVELHNVFVPLQRYRGRYDAIHVGGAMQESRLGALLELLGPKGGRIVAPVSNELRLVTKYPDGSVRQRMLSQVSFSELEVPRDVDVVRALLQEQADEARRVEVPPSTFASDLAHLAAPGVDLASEAEAAAAPPQGPGPGAGPSTSSSAAAAAAAAPDAASSRRGSNGVRLRSFTSLANAHMAPATLPPAHRPSGREGSRGAHATAAAADAEPPAAERGASAAAGGAAAGGGGWGWQWERAAAAAQRPPLQRRRHGADNAARAVEAGRMEVDGHGDADADAGEKVPLLETMGEAAAAPAGPIEAEPDEAAAAGPPVTGAEQREGGGGGDGAAADSLSYLAGVADVLALGPTDCELEGASWRLPAHKAVLQARCELLRAHMGSGMRDSDSTRYLVPEAVERRDAVEAFLHYVYKDRLPDELGSEVVPQLLHAGIYFGCNRLVRLCEALLAQGLMAASGGASGSASSAGAGDSASSGGVASPSEAEELAAAVGSAGPLLALADEGGLDQLRRVALNFVLDHFPAVSATEGYCHLPRPLVDAVAAEAVGRYEALLQQLERLSAQQPQGMRDY